jgi:hypothetical protein
MLAVMRDRVRIMTLCARNGALPVFGQELGKADKSICCQQATRKLLKRARPLMAREYSNADGHACLALSEVLKSSQSLAITHRFREQPRDHWNNAGLPQDKHLDALRGWYLSAEQSSVGYLRDFALKLRGCALAPVPLSAWPLRLLIKTADEAIAATIAPPQRCGFFPPAWLDTGAGPQSR